MAGKYVNPIPYVDKSEKYELRLCVTYPEPIEVDKAKEIAADFIMGMTKEELVKFLHAEIN